MRAEYDFSNGKRGPVVKGKTRISIYIDNAILDEFRARAGRAGMGYQTMMNEALRASLSRAQPAVTEQVLRNVLRQEIPKYAVGAGMETTRLSSKGQVVLPSSIRAAKSWRTGQALAVVSTDEGVLLKPLKAFEASTLAEVAGSLRYKGPPKTLAQMEAAVAAEARRRRK